MNKLVCLFLVFSLCRLDAQNQGTNQQKLSEDLNQMLADIERNYVYLEDKNVDLECLRGHYSNLIKTVTAEDEIVLLFEYLLDEFYDNHLTLTTNRNRSYRLFAPIYVTLDQQRVLVANVWQSQVEPFEHDLMGAEVLKFNNVGIDEMIKAFPTHCSDKNDPEVREWVANKILAGRYSQPRIVTLELKNGQVVQIDLDAVQFNNDDGLLSTTINDDIGIIRINNSLGNDDLVTEFDAALDNLLSTQGLIIDLRNTIFGGDSYEARGIMSRFIEAPRPYQRHAYAAKSENNPDVERNWLEFVTPRGTQYTAPVVVLVGRWTGSMGEGLAIGFEGMERGEVIGTEMRRLAGEVNDQRLPNQWFAYKLSTAKLYHVNGTIREEYIPTHYVRQTTTQTDEALQYAMEFLKKN